MDSDADNDAVDVMEMVQEEGLLSQEEMMEDVVVLDRDSDGGHNAGPKPSENRPKTNI